MALTDTEKQQLGIVEDTGLHQSIYSAARKDPDISARIVEMSDSQQLPMDTVERNPIEIKARHQYGDLDLVELYKNHPITADYLSNKKNGAVSIDDIPTLTALEDNLKPEHGFWSNTGRGGCQSNQ